MGQKQAIKLFRKKVKLIDKITFIQNLAVMIKAGISILEALETVSEDIDNSALKDTVNNLTKSLQKGDSIHSSLQKEKDFLGPAHMGILEAGEISGQLYESLDRIKTDLQKEYDLFQKIKGALSYPTIILLALLGIGGAIIVFILPKIADVFKRMGVALPLPTRIMIAVGTFVSQNKILVLLVTIGAVFALVSFLRSTPGRKILYAVISRLPIVRSLVNDINFTRFTRTLSILVKSGVDIDKSLDISSRVFPIQIREIISGKIVKEVRKGSTLAESMRQHKKVFPGMVVRMVSVGENTGKLNDVLEELSGHYERGVDAKLTILTNMLEPLLMLVVGLAIGGAVLSIIAPIYSMVGSLQQSQF